MKGLGNQRLIDGVRTAQRALAQGSPEHPQQHVGIGNDAGHKTGSTWPCRAARASARVPAVSGEHETGGAAPGNDRVPRGAIAVVIVGLIATLAAALLADENLSGEAAALEWVQERPIPDSQAVDVPGASGQQMQLSGGHLRATGVNVSGYSLFSAGMALRFDAGAPIGGARILCTQRALGGAEVAQTPGLRASYPRSSEGGKLATQELPQSGIEVEFSSHGTYAAEVKLENLPATAANEPGINLEWPSFRIGVERWRWFLPPGPPKVALALPFLSVWRTQKIPAVKISCQLETSAGKASVQTAAAFKKLSEPIAE